MKEVIMQVGSFSIDYPKAPIYVGDLVRCKDCRYYSPIDEDKPFPCAYGLYMCNKDDFCSYGERKDGDLTRVNGTDK